MKTTSQFNAKPKLLAIAVAGLMSSLSMQAIASAALTADAMISTKTPTKNAGSAVSLSLANTGTAKQTGLLKFNLSGSLPAGAVSNDIAKATLKVFVSKVAKNASGLLVVDTAGSSWQEATVNGASAIAASGSYSVSKNITTSSLNQWLEFDVTNAVKAGVSAADIAFALDVSTGLSLDIDSKESKTTSHAATLDILYATAGSQGATGPIGPAGATGPAGPQGVQGIQGPIGATGPQGATGNSSPEITATGTATSITGIYNVTPAVANPYPVVIDSAGQLGSGKTLYVPGNNNWDLTNTEGDFRVGNSIDRLKIGVATGGGGAGDISIKAQGGLERLNLVAPTGGVRVLSNNHWDLSTSEGDFNIGNGLVGIKIGVPQTGGGTGDIAIKAFGDTGLKRMSFQAEGGYNFYTNLNKTTGATLASGSGSWSSLSDRNSKENLQTVDGEEILSKLDAMTISTWNYKSQDAKIRHIGPMAQDFYAAFAVGEDEKRISTVDADGVALAAIKALNQKLAEKDHQIEQLQNQLDEIRARLDAQ